MILSEEQCNNARLLYDAATRLDDEVAKGYAHVILHMLDTIDALRADVNGLLHELNNEFFD